MFDSAFRLPAAEDIEQALASDAPAGTLPLDLLTRMQVNHAEQWNAEDGCRAAEVPMAGLGRLKRRIDELNAARTGLIEEVDAWVRMHIDQSPTALPHTETYGALLDRIVISWLRHSRVGPADSPWAQAAQRQHAELLRSYDGLVQGVRAGERRLPDWRSLKFYGRHDVSMAGTTSLSTEQCARIGPVGGQRADR